METSFPQERQAREQFTQESERQQEEQAPEPEDTYNEPVEEPTYNEPTEPEPAQTSAQESFEPEEYYAEPEAPKQEEDVYSEATDPVASQSGDQGLTAIALYDYQASECLLTGHAEITLPMPAFEILTISFLQGNKHANFRSFIISPFL